MTVDIILGVCLALSLGVNFYQFRFWSRQVQVLIDKLMSRNYADYVYSQKPVENKLPIDNNVDENEVLEEINRLLPS